MAERGAAPEGGVDQPACKRRGGAPRGRARLRHWRVEHPRKVFRCSLVSSSRTPTRSAGEETGEHQGAAFRTSALAALHSLARGMIVARMESGEDECKARAQRSHDVVERPPGRAEHGLFDIVNPKMATAAGVIPALARPRGLLSIAASTACASRATPMPPPPAASAPPAGTARRPAPCCGSWQAPERTPR
jgi:hypothetical protein